MTTIDQLAAMLVAWELEHRYGARLTNVATDHDNERWMIRAQVDGGTFGAWGETPLEAFQQLARIIPTQ